MTHRGSNPDVFVTGSDGIRVFYYPLTKGHPKQNDGDGEPVGRWASRRGRGVFFAQLLAARRFFRNREGPFCFFGLFLVFFRRSVAVCRRKAGSPKCGFSCFMAEHGING